MGAKGRMPGILIVLSAGAGVILGGTMVAICMGLAAVGGLIAYLRDFPTNSFRVRDVVRPSVRGAETQTVPIAIHRE